MKIDWPRLIFVSLFNGILTGLVAKAFVFGLVIFVATAIGEMIYGAIFGKKEV